MARQACANRSPSLSTRTIGVPGLHDGAWSRRARPGCTELTADGGPRGFESISLQQRVSDEPLLAPEPSRSASVQETTGGSTGHPKNLRGTDGSNPSPSSRQSVSLPQPLSKVENPAFPRGSGQLAWRPGQQRRARLSIVRQPAAISLSGHIPVPQCR